MDGPEPTPTEHDQISRLLRTGSEGDSQALATLFEQVYAELHAVAQRHMAQEKIAHTLQPTALVHEAWLRLAGSSGCGGADRNTFFATAARAMRQVLIDHARKRGRRKRGGDLRRLPENLLELATECDIDDVLAVDEALENLRAQDERAARIVELRFFAGLSVAEVATILESSERTVEREWAYARAWLFRALA